MGSEVVGREEGAEGRRCASTAICTGSLRLRRARSETDLVWVAEKRRVWRDGGRWERRAERVFEKPRSRIRSASSRTAFIHSCVSLRRKGEKGRRRYRPRIWRFPASKPTVSSMCWRSRPGVATRMFILANLSFSTFTSFPPMTKPAENEWNPPMDRRTWNICTACVSSSSVAKSKLQRKGLTSSLVGEITNAPSPSCGPHLLRYSASSTGMRNASVFPLPVCAAPRTSLPLSEMGTLRCWIGVMVVKKAFLRPGHCVSYHTRRSKV